jgi:hypothetical protein
MHTASMRSPHENQSDLGPFGRLLGEARLRARRRLPPAPSERRSRMALSRAVLIPFVLSSLAATSARADLFSLTASGAITFNSSGDGTIPVGTPWAFELVYDTDAPDLDFEQSTSPDPTFGLYKNTGAPPALTSFHYRAGDYEVAIGEPAGFDTLSDVIITFESVHAIDIDIRAPASFPNLAGGEVSFHADFNDLSSRPVFQGDALPTDPSLDLGSFDEVTVALLAPAGEVSSAALSTFEIAPVPEPSLAALEIAGLLTLFGLVRDPRRGIEAELQRVVKE